MTKEEKERTEEVRQGFIVELNTVNNALRDMLHIVHTMPDHLERQRHALARQLSTLMNATRSIYDVVEGMGQDPKERGVMWHAARTRGAATTICGAVVAPTHPTESRTTVAHFRKIHADPNANWCQECSAVLLGEEEQEQE